MCWRAKVATAKYEVKKQHVATRMKFVSQAAYGMISFGPAPASGALRDPAGAPALMLSTP